MFLVCVVSASCYVVTVEMRAGVAYTTFFILSTDIIPVCDSVSGFLTLFSLAGNQVSRDGRVRVREVSPGLEEVLFFDNVM